MAIVAANCAGFSDSVAADSTITRLRPRAPGAFTTTRWLSSLNRSLTKVVALMALVGSSGCYGRQGIGCGRTRLVRLMRQLGLQPVQKCRFRPKTTQSLHPNPIAPHRLNQLPLPLSAPNQA